MKWPAKAQAASSSLRALTRFYETGDATGYMQAVWEETQVEVDWVLQVEEMAGRSGKHANFVGTFLGLAFRRRELVYDDPLPSTKH